ncbi:pancortin-3 [Paraburkholderia tropica]|uniref:Cap15 family cyclic dinucleotide receptor domain-containing protein n=1 Tax=Paraburkholderia tropica TaxID=92647 RepID=UPI001592A244|nr:pancortin-3 [Paraburkholderia tropica]
MIGHSRATIGRWLGVAAGLLTGGLASLVTLSATLVAAMGWTDHKPHPIAIPVTATTFYVLGHFLFDRWLWRRSIIPKMLGIPDLNGKWSCQGQTLDPETGAATHTWQATVTIVQTWEKIKVYLDTGQSRSRSVAASILKEDGVGFILMYSYRNEPKPGEPDLKAHIGYCELHIDEKQSTASGMYFNSGGRLTHGKMVLNKEPENGKT